MPRRRLIKTSRFPYHVTARSNNKDWFYLPLDQCWRIFCAQLADTAAKYDLQIYAFTLMSNHFHLIVQTPQSPLGDVMRHFLTETSKEIQRQANRINHVFGARYKWSILRDARATAYVHKYVLRNPVRAGIVTDVGDYPYSSLQLDAARRFPLVESLEPLWGQVPKPIAERLAWLNQPTEKELEVEITHGLRRTYFSFSKDNAKQKSIRDLKVRYEPAGNTGDPYDFGERDLSSLKGD